MKKLAVSLLLCLLLSVRPSAMDRDVMYNTEVVLTRFYSSTVIYPVFDGDWNTKRVKSAALRLADRGAEYILERQVRGGCARDNYSLRVDSSLTYNKEGIARVTLTLHIFKNGTIIDMDIIVIYIIQHSADSSSFKI